MEQHQQQEDQDRGRRLFFSKEDDMELMGLVINEDPFKNPYRWAYIADVLKERRKKNFTAKNVKQRTHHLITLFRARDNKLQVTSGKEEGYDELEQRLQQASDLKKEVESNPTLKNRRMKKEMANLGKAIREDAAFSMNVEQVPDKQVSVEIVSNDDDFLLCEDLSEVKEENESIVEPNQQPIVQVQLEQSTGIRTELLCDSETNNNSTTRVNPRFTPTLLSSQRVSTPHRTPQAARRATKRSMEQQMWAKLKEERMHKAELVAVEKMKAENERLKLETEQEKARFDYDLECKKLKVQEMQMQQIQQFQDKVLLLFEKLAKNQPTV